MKKLNPAFLALLMILYAGSLSAQDLQLQWAKAINGTHHVTITKSVTDAQGNLYIVGYFMGTADFDPGAGTTNLTTGTTPGNGSGYFAKYNAQGDYQFAYALGDTGVADVRDIALDNNGNICLLGTFEGTNDFDMSGGVANLTSTGALDIFVARYDSDGNYLNAFNIGGTGTDGAYAIAADGGSNSIYICGHFYGTVDFDPGPGVANLVSGSTDHNGYIAKYSTSGTFQYANKLNSTDNSEVQDIVVDANGNLFAGGMFFTDIDVDPGTGTTIFNALAGVDGFWAKYDPSGNYLSGSSHNGGINLITVDGNDNFYIAGRIGDSMDADPGPGTAMLYSINQFDDYFAKYDNNGNYLNARVFESNATYLQTGLTIDANNSLYMYGRFLDTVDFNPGGPDGELISAGFSDMFITRFDATGSLSLAYGLGSGATDIANSIVTNAQGNVWISGIFNDTVDFDVESGVTQLVSNAAQGGFFAKYQDPQFVSVPKVSGNTASVKAYGTDNSVIIDFTALDKVNAEVAVTNMLGQTVAHAKHYRNDMLKINLADAAAQLYVVIIYNNGTTTAKKVWVK